MILAGDIGGTTTRLAWFEASGGPLRRTFVGDYPSRDYAGLEAIVREFVDTHRHALDHAAFGIAGPVRAGRVVTTNLPWTVEVDGLAAALRVGAVSLLNDVEANAYGIAVLHPGDFAVLNAGDANPCGNMAVIAAGTGLGEAGAVWDGQRLLPFACEGGHADFAPRDPVEMELLEHLRQRFGHVSWERVVSGPGLCNIYGFLRDSGRGTEQSWVRERMQEGDAAAAIARAASAGQCELCSQALDRLVSLYAAEAGNLALKLMATGGVHLGGGIAPKILDALRGPAFMRSFAAKGRMRDLLEAMPVRVILNDDAALLGAARYAALKAGLADPAAVAAAAPDGREDA
ncbi:MAG TPA: glucokinase [Casimicrobiaceae bacterium]|nr:glucokinase [Casimicrobiaceae bacterium]